MARSYRSQHDELAFPFSVEEVVRPGRHARQRGLERPDAADLAAAREALAACDVAQPATRRFDEPRAALWGGR